MVCKAKKDEDIRAFYCRSWVTVGSDTGLGMRRPRGAGTYLKVLGQYVRERRCFTLPQAIDNDDRGPCRAGEAPAAISALNRNRNGVREQSNRLEPRQSH